MLKNLRVSPIVFLILMLLGASISAQDLNPSFIKGRILKGTSFDTVIYSRLPIQTVSLTNASAGEVSESVVETGLQHRFTYTPASDFAGRASFIIERASDESLDIPSFTPIEVDVVPSLLQANHDVASILSGDNSTLIDVLVNDIPGNGSITLLGTELVSNGSVAQNGNTFVFTAEAGFEGKTSFTYFISDNDGFKTSGQVTVNVIGDPIANESTLTYSLLSGERLNIFLDDNYVLADGELLMDYASLSPITNHIYEYQASPYFAGIERFDLVKGNGELVHVEINVIDNRIFGAYVVDDKHFTSVDQPISFDPFENDYRQDGLLIAYSDELILENGVFVFTPEAGFSGVKEFFYTLFDGNQESTGKIEIYVGNYLPQKSAYNFTTKEGTPVAIQYDAPIKGYTWNVTNNPNNGSVLAGLGSYIHENSNCSSISGYQLLVYRPNTSYIGSDEFSIEYCAPNGACKEIEIQVNIVESDDECPCYGDDCVWAGDADNNGKVSVQDLLAIGYNYGASGTARGQSSIEWCANYAEDWAFDQEGGDENIKYVDANGDGLITVADTMGIAANNASYHNVASKEVLAEKEDVLSFTPSQNSVKKDEIIYVEISLGSDAKLVEDRQGIAFSFQVPTDIFKKDKIHFYPNTDWFGENSPVLTMSTITDGLVEIAMVRTASSGAFGKGILGTLQIEGQTDLDGFRPAEDEIPVDLIFSEAVVTDGTGQKFSIQTESALLMYQFGDDRSQGSLEPEVTIFPNPSEYQLSFHARNNDELVSVSIYSVTGALAYSKTDIGEKNLTIDHNLSEGMYVATVQTQKGLVNQTVVISR
ncbi:MAG: hypothetical protein ACI9FN_002703 [Saprospiraceae bacterium]|jgi:hypothetical protein